MPAAIEAVVDAPPETLRQRLDRGLERWGIRGLGDPRIPFALILTVYGVLGFTWLGFNRSAAQMGLIVASGCALDMALGAFVHRRVQAPLSAYISCCSLALLLNYSHGTWLLLVPVLLAIGSKYLLTVNGKHHFNPSMFGVAVSLLVSRELITAAPAYQWAGASVTMSAFILMAALTLFVFKIGRGALIVSFLVTYALQTAVRAYVMRHHLPPEVLFIGTLSAPPFFIFTFYMITDPATSPPDRPTQVKLGIALALVDLWLHTKESVYTFFYAALLVGLVRFVVLHARALWSSPREWLRPTRTFVRSAAVLVPLAGATAFAVYREAAEGGVDPGFRMVPMAPAHTGVAGRGCTLLTEVDPRVQHVAKWVLSIGDAVSVADVDNDGRVDLFVTNLLKEREDRNALYRNMGDLRFERVPMPLLDREPKAHGVPGGGTFVDFDGDGDVDLAVPVAFGRSRLLQNRLVPDGVLAFDDVSESWGLTAHTVSVAISFLDVDRDARLDLLVANAMTPVVRDTDPPVPLNIFDLPPPAYDGDRRMFQFMHDGWHDANNGGPNWLYRNVGGRFERVPAPGFVGTRWSLAVSTIDLNADGWTDLYVANDFGPDEAYLNRGGRFEPVLGERFGEIGRDTYKGMNASIADFDRNGRMDVYVSNVHHALQSEGSLLWMNRADPADPFVPELSDEATARGALNPRRFGWGAATPDLDLDGWDDIVQANGMVDDRCDEPVAIPDQGWFSGLFRDHRDYWYVNQKLMQAGPELHQYADKWGDIRGRVIYPNEARRAYLNQGANGGEATFLDAAEALGIAAPDNSRGVAAADFDDDGDMDLVITNQHGPPSIYRSTAREALGRDFVGLTLVGNGTTTHRSAIGSQVRLRWKNASGEQRTLREVGTLTGFGGQSDPRLHTGLGSGAGDVEVEVRWLGGSATRHTLAPNRYHEVRQPPE